MITKRPECGERILRNPIADEWFRDMFGYPFDDEDVEAAIPSVKAPVDVREYDDRYELELDLPGFNKSDINVELKEGRLDISATHSEEHTDGTEEKSVADPEKAETDDIESREKTDTEKNGQNEIKSTDTDLNVKKNDCRYIRRERFRGTVERSFFVGKNVKSEDISAKFNNGVLLVDIAKVKRQETPKADKVQIQ